MMRELSQFDLFTGENTNMYIITKAGIKNINVNDIFTQEHHKKNLFSQFLENMLNEIPEVSILLLEFTNAEIISRLFSSLFKDQIIAEKFTQSISKDENNG